MRPQSRTLVRVVLATAVAVSSTSCGKKTERPASNTVAPSPAEENTPLETQRYVQAAERFVRAVANRKYDEAYGMLSSHAKSRMTPNQFVAPADALTLQHDLLSPLSEVSAKKFDDLMKEVEELYGVPQAIESLVVFSTDPSVLARLKQDESGHLDCADAIGAMPDAIPTEIRRASIHAQIATQLTPSQLEQTAAAMDLKPEELQDDPSFKPSFNMKLVLVEEDGQVVVGYFEVLPASRWN